MSAWWTLTEHRGEMAPALLVAVTSAILGCGGDSSNAEGSGSSEMSSGTTENVDSSTAATESATTETSMSASVTSAATLDTSVGTSSGGVDDCPPGDPNQLAASAIANAPEFPSGGFVDVSCDAISIEREPSRLVSSCVHPVTRAPTEIRINAVSVFENQLAWLPGTSDLRVSFYKKKEDVIGCGACTHLTIRDSAGDLLLLSHTLNLFDAYPDEGSAFEVGKAGWLEPGTPEYEAWSAPFAELMVRNMGCGARENVRPGSESETPLALELGSDNGLVWTYDRTTTPGVEVDGQAFDILVSDAFFRGPLNCGDCPVTESSFLIVRAAD